MDRDLRYILELWLLGMRESRTKWVVRGFRPKSLVRHNYFLPETRLGGVDRASVKKYLNPSVCCVFTSGSRAADACGVWREASEPGAGTAKKILEGQEKGLRKNHGLRTP